MYLETCAIEYEWFEPMSNTSIVKDHLGDFCSFSRGV